jgi:hypothetical protein
MSTLTEQQLHAKTVFETVENFFDDQSIGITNSKFTEYFLISSVSNMEEFIVDFNLRYLRGVVRIGLCFKNFEKCFPKDAMQIYTFSRFLLLNLQSSERNVVYAVFNIMRLYKNVNNLISNLGITPFIKILEKNNTSLRKDAVHMLKWVIQYNFKDSHNGALDMILLCCKRNLRYPYDLRLLKKMAYIMSILISKADIRTISITAVDLVIHATCGSFRKTPWSYFILALKYLCEHHARHILLNMPISLWKEWMTADIDIVGDSTTNIALILEIFTKVIPAEDSTSFVIIRKMFQDSIIFRGVSDPQILRIYNVILRTNLHHEEEDLIVLSVIIGCASSEIYSNHCFSIFETYNEYSRFYQLTLRRISLSGILSAMFLNPKSLTELEKRAFTKLRNAMPFRNDSSMDNEPFWLSAPQNRTKTAIIAQQYHNNPTFPWIYFQSMIQMPVFHSLTYYTNEDIFFNRLSSTVKIFYPVGSLCSGEYTEFQLFDYVSRIRLAYFKINIKKYQAKIPPELLEFFSKITKTGSISSLHCLRIGQTFCNDIPPIRFSYRDTSGELQDIDDDVHMFELFYNLKSNTEVHLIQHETFDHELIFEIPLYFPPKSFQNALSPYSESLMEFVIPPIDTFPISANAAVRYMFPMESLFTESSTITFIRNNVNWFNVNLRYYTAMMILLPFSQKLKICLEHELRYILDDKYIEEWLRVKVNRNEIYSTGRKMFEILGPNPLPFKIIFENEIPAYDNAVSSTLEFYKLFTREFAQRIFFMEELTRARLPNPNTSLDDMYLFGVLIAKAFLMRTHLNIQLSEHFFDLMREIPMMTTSDGIRLTEKRRMLLVDPQIDSSLENRQPVKFIHPRHNELELMEHGNEVPIENTDEIQFYWQLVAGVTCGEAYREVMRTPFIEGFSSVYPKYGQNSYEILTSLLTNTELCEELDGGVTITLKQISEWLVPIRGYVEESFQIKNIREIVYQMNFLTKRRFLTYVSGNQIFPDDETQPILPTINIISEELEIVENADYTYPRVDMTEHSLYLPFYTSKEVMKEKLLHMIDITVF